MFIKYDQFITDLISLKCYLCNELDQILQMNLLEYDDFYF